MHSTSWGIGPDSLYPLLGRGRKKSAPFSTSKFLALFVGNTLGLFLKKIPGSNFLGSGASKMNLKALSPL